MSDSIDPADRSMLDSEPGRLPEDATSKPGQRPADSSTLIPPWYPAWSRELAELYFSATTCLFVLHGNVHDLVCCDAGLAVPPVPGDRVPGDRVPGDRVPGDRVPGDGDLAGGERFCSVEEFLARQLFGTWDLVLSYDLGHGLRPLAAGDGERYKQMARQLSPWGTPDVWPREPEKVLAMLDRLVDRACTSGTPSSGKSIGIVFPHAQYLIPQGEVSTLAGEQAGRLVRLLGWAQNPYVRRMNIAFCLIAERLSELNDRLVQNPHVATIEIPLPDRDQRRRFAQTLLDARPPEVPSAGISDADRIADISGGLSLVNLNVLARGAHASGKALDPARFRELKKSIIERQCGQLLEFIEPEHTLDMVVGHLAARQRLERDAHWIAEGRLDAAPMGYLLCGPVGTGKSFLAECYAGTIGIPCVRLRNFRSKYVGETEGNLQRVFTVLRSLGPVVVMVDEADAALGSRAGGGDSGISGRVFSMIASQMGDTRYRGKIVWMLLTCRPDLLPIDLKRQGRAEVHIPLFYPHEPEQLTQMLTVMARKNGITLAAREMPDWGSDPQLSGADVESILLSAHRLALAGGRDRIESLDLAEAARRFIPSAQGLEKELQEIVAVLECTDLEFLPPPWEAQIEPPEGRSRLERRLATIRHLVT